MDKIPIRENLFREENGEIALLAAKCPECGKVMFPKRVFCTQCLNDAMEEIELSRCGTLYTYTILRVGEEHYDPPHPLGIIDFPLERVRVTAPLVWREEGYEIGQTMEVVPDVLWEEEERAVTGYRFRVVD